MQNIQDACQSLLEISNVIHYTSNGVANLSSLLCTSRIRYIRKHLHHYSLWFYHHICSFLSLKWQMCKTKVWIWSLVPCETWCPLPACTLYKYACQSNVSKMCRSMFYKFPTRFDSQIYDVLCEHAVNHCFYFLKLICDILNRLFYNMNLNHSFFWIHTFANRFIFSLKLNAKNRRHRFCVCTQRFILYSYCAYKESVSFIHIESNTWKLSFDIVVSIESSALALILILYFMCFFSINCIEMKGWMIFFHLICCKA